MKAFEKLTVSNVVKELNSEIYMNGLERSNTATGVIQGGAIYYRVDGGLPQDGLGMFVGNGDIINLVSNQEIKEFKAIRSGSVDAVLSFDYSSRFTNE